MTKEEITKLLNEIFREVFNDDRIVIHNEMTSKDIDNWNSLTHMVLTTNIEDRFNIRFKLRELNKLRQVGDLINTIESKL